MAKQDMDSFIKELSYLTRRNSFSQVFDDFLTFTICSFSLKTMEETYLERAARYDKDQLYHFAKLLSIWMLHHDQTIKPVKSKSEAGETSYPWEDFLGEVYQQTSSSFQRSGSGQFFTPVHICDMMTALIQPDGDGAILDPACGSARNLVSAHCRNPSGRYYVGVDLDPMCAKISALNMWSHGMKGEAICANSLSDNDYRFGYAVNPKLIYPFIFDLEKDKSLYWSSRDDICHIKKQEPIEIKLDSGKSVQKTLFDLPIDEKKQK